MIDVSQMKRRQLLRKSCRSSRKLKQCPIEGCRSKPQVKLSNHLTYKHPDLSKAEREEALKNAKAVPTKETRKGRRPAIAGQLRLTQVVRERTPPQTSYTQSLKTRGFPKFELGKGGGIDELTRHFMSVEGGLKEEREARQVTVDVSKFLRFCGATLDWKNLSKVDKLREYLEVARKAGVGVSGTITKCDRVIAGIRFAKMKLAPSDVTLTASYDRAIDRITMWKKVYRQEQEKKRALQMEGDSSRPVDLSKMTSVLRSTRVWQHFDEVAQAGQDGMEVSDKELKRATVAMATLLMFKAAQRPGAVAHAKVADFNQATLEEVGDADEGVMVIRVPDHKTSTKGPARLTVGLEDYSRLQAYVDHLRPLMDPGEESELLLILPGPRPLSNIHNHISKFGESYGIKVPTATDLRKAIATVAATECSSGEVALLSNQMSHSVATHKRYYENLKSRKHAAMAHQAMEKLMAPPPPPPPPAKRPQLKRTKRPYTDGEVKAIMAAFGKEIAMGQTPTSQSCRDFLALNPTIDRDYKQIQDKVRTINETQ